MPVKILLSPSENQLATLLGNEAIVSSIPESKGADVLLYTAGGLLGIQRKQVPHDFISSFTDGRMSQSLASMKHECAMIRVLCEGRFRYWPDTTVDMGMLKNRQRVPSRFTKKHIRGMLNDIMFVHGIMVDWTENINDTVDYIKSARDFLSVTKHLGLYSRPPAKGAWVVPSAKDIDL